jgi:predicted AlkP superfamily phosphohydrolase/phosphomutase
MSSRVVLLGICAASRDLLSQWATAGVLPNYRSAMERGLTGFIDSMPGFYVGTTWPSFATCVSPARHSRHYILQLEPGTYRLRREPKGHGIRREPFWQELSRAGRKVALFDIPHAALSEGFDGMQVVEWGAHDGDFGNMLTRPTTLGREIDATFGPHPAPRACDGSKTTAQIADFRDRLVAGAATRAEIARHYLAQEDWDFFAQVWTESHCAGHQCWHVHDPEHPRHDAGTAAVIGDPIRDVYVAIDAAIGRVLDAIDGNTTVILFTGHGMGAKYDSQHFLDDILLRLGYATPPPTQIAHDRSKSARRHRRVDDLLTGAWQSMPRGLKQLAEPFRTSLRALVEHARPEPLPKIDPAASRCFAVPNNAVHGGIRINLAGREPEGKVARGAECDTLCERLAADILDIVNADTGRPIADRVLRADRFYSGECLDFLPDVLIEWNQESPVSSITSDRIGRLDGADPYTRTGDHRKGGVFVAIGPHIRPGRLARAVDVCDFGPTIARLLGIDLRDTDGMAIDEILPDAARLRERITDGSSERRYGF